MERSRAASASSGSAEERRFAIANACRVASSAFCVPCNPPSSPTRDKRLPIATSAASGIAIDHRVVLGVAVGQVLEAGHGGCQEPATDLVRGGHAFQLTLDIEDDRLQSSQRQRVVFLSQLGLAVFPLSAAASARPKLATASLLPQHSTSADPFPPASAPAAPAQSTFPRPRSRRIAAVAAAATRCRRGPARDARREERIAKCRNRLVGQPMLDVVCHGAGEGVAFRGLQCHRLQADRLQRGWNRAVERRGCGKSPCFTLCNMSLLLAS